VIGSVKELNDREDDEKYAQQAEERAQSKNEETCTVTSRGGKLSRKVEVRQRKGRNAPCPG
jgi:hypothetical protein